MTVVYNRDVISKIKEVGVQKCSQWLFEGADSGSEISSNIKSYESLCNRLYNKYKKLAKHKTRGSDFDNFMSCTVINPQAEQMPREYGREKSENIKCLQEKTETLANVGMELAEELNTSKGEIKVLTEELHEVRNTSRLKLSKIGNIKKLKDDLKYQKKREQELLKTNKMLRSRLNIKNGELKRQRLKVSYEESRKRHKTDKLRIKAEQIENLQNEIEAKEIELNIEQIHVQDLKDQARDTELEYGWLREMVNDSIITYDEQSRMYTSDLQQCVFELLNYNVSFSNVSPVIQCVLSLAQCRPNKLPCKSTVNNMNLQRLALSQKHIAEELTSKHNLCLLSDETNKFGTKFEGMHATDSTGAYWVLGIREMTTKASTDILKSLLDILGDIDVISNRSENPASKQILKNIVSTMSDRASTQTKFNDLLESFRTEILKEELGEHWDSMTEEEQLSLSQLCNFFCSLHALVHMADTCSKTLIEVDNVSFDESPILEKSFKKANEPGAVRLVRTCCKSFAKGGDEKNGKFQPFTTYVRDMLKEKGFKSVPLERFRGNRFNILFRNAAVVFFLKDEIKTYLNLDSSNRLLAAVKHDMNVPEYLAGCKALGLISELITIPLWCIIENENIHVTEAGAMYQELVEYLEHFMDNSDEFLKGNYKLSFADAAKLNQSSVFASLTRDWEHDAKVMICLQAVMPALCQLCRRLFKDHLPGGIWYQSTDIVKQKTSGVPKHNKFSESIFGHMDRLLREKPNTTQIAIEANIMFVHNKTLSWLEGKCQKERDQIVSEARQDVKSLREASKLRRAHIETERRQQLQDKREKAQRAEQAKIEKKEKLTDGIQVYGLWQSEGDVDSALKRIDSKTEKRKAIKSQLNFREKVLRQKTNDKTVYRISKKDGNKSRVLSIEELTVNVKKLVRNSYTEVFINIDKNDDDQPLIVGRRISHAFHENEGITWYSGQVVSQVPGFPEWFNVHYLGDRAIYTYELLVDYRRGDLKLLV